MDPISFAGVKHAAWSDAQDKRLRELADEHYSASQIGAALGRSRNSVIGRAHRQGVLINSQRVPARVKQEKKASRKLTSSFLAARNAKIFAMLAEGVDRAQIAASLGITYSAVKCVILRRKPGARAQITRASPPVEDFYCGRAVPFMDALMSGRGCRWHRPGHAGMSGLVCGSDLLPGRPYCEHHFVRSAAPDYRMSARIKASAYTVQVAA